MSKRFGFEQYPSGSHSLCCKITLLLLEYWISGNSYVLLDVLNFVASGYCVLIESHYFGIKLIRYLSVLCYISSRESSYIV